MILLDTNVLLFDTLSPERLSSKVRKIFQMKHSFACSGISLFEISMLAAKKRINLPVDTNRFLKTLLIARNIEVLPINPDIAAMSQSFKISHKDPMDLMIAATAIFHKIPLASSDSVLRKIEGLEVIW